MGEDAGDAPRICPTVHCVHCNLCVVTCYITSQCKTWWRWRTKCWILITLFKVKNLMTLPRTSCLVTSKRKGYIHCVFLCKPKTFPPCHWDSFIHISMDKMLFWLFWMCWSRAVCGHQPRSNPKTHSVRKIVIVWLLQLLFPIELSRILCEVICTLPGEGKAICRLWFYWFL